MMRSIGDQQVAESVVTDLVRRRERNLQPFAAVEYFVSSGDGVDGAAGNIDAADGIAPGVRVIKAADVIERQLLRPPDERELRGYAVLRRLPGARDGLQK